MAGSLSDEEIRIRLGYDAKTVDIGTQAMLANQTRAAAKYVDIWKAAALSREQIEKKAYDRSEIMAKNAAYLEQQRISNFVNNSPARKAMRAKRDADTLAELGGVSGGFGSVAAREAKMAGNAVESAAGGSGHGGIGGIVRELGVLAREASRGSWNRAAGSLSILITRMGSFGAVAARVGGILGAVVGAGAIGYESIKAGRAATQSNQSTHALATQTAGMSGRVGDVIDQMEQAGQITKAQADQMRGDIHSNDGIRRVQSRLIGLRDKAAAFADQQAGIKGGYDDTTAAATKELEQRQQKEHSLAEYAADRVSREKENVNLQERLAKLDKDSVEAAKLRSRIATNELEIDKDRTAEKEKQAQTDSMNRSMRGLRESRDDVIHGANMVDRETPTLGELAGRGFTKNLDRAYGVGGRFDLAAGDGPFAGIAQDALLAQKQQRWDVIHGNAVFDAKGNLIGGAAAEDRQRQITAENKLSAAGLDTPAMQFKKMAQHLQDINTDMADLLEAAKKSGIKIKDE